jgi:hypothetical protein
MTSRAAAKPLVVRHPIQAGRVSKTMSGNFGMLLGRRRLKHIIPKNRLVSDFFSSKPTKRRNYPWLHRVRREF